MSLSHPFANQPGHLTSLESLAKLCTSDRAFFFSGLKSLSLNLSRLDACRLLGRPSPRIEASWSYEMHEIASKLPWKLRFGRGPGRVAPWRLPLSKCSNDFFREWVWPVFRWVGPLERANISIENHGTAKPTTPQSKEVQHLLLPASSLFISFISGCLQNLLEKSTMQGENRK